jgi:uncharacterized protein
VWSAIATGAIWGVWHYPLIVLTGFNYPDSPVLGLVPFTLFTILMSVILGWLQLRADSWAPSLAHSGVNYFSAPVLAAVFPGASALMAGIGGFVALSAYTLVAGWIVATAGCADGQPRLARQYAPTRTRRYGSTLQRGSPTPEAHPAG